MTRGEIRPAQAADIEPVCKLLHEQMSAKFSLDRWRRLMTYRWLDEKPDFGRVAFVDGRLVGFVGMVYANRVLDGRPHRVVNVCAWYLEKAYRKAGFGFELMRSAIADDTMSYTILTSSPRSVALLDAIGYRVLDDHRQLWAAKGASVEIKMERDLPSILGRIDGITRGMLRDHGGLPIHTILVSDNSGDCLVVFTVAKKREGVTYFDVLHLTNPSFFAARAQVIADGLLPRDQTAVLAVDTRLLQGNAHDGTAERLLVPRFYKSNTLQAEQIDNMYSELQLLDLKLD